MNNSTKTLSESELARQRVLAIHRHAHICHPDARMPFTVMATKSRKGYSYQCLGLGETEEAAWQDSCSRLPQPLSEDRPHNQPIPCPTCTGPIFVREDSSIVAHYNGDGDRCAANETKMPCDCWKHERQVCDICQKFDPHAKDEDREDNFTRAARFAGISFSQGIQFHLFMLHLLGKGPEPGFLLDSQKPVLKDGPSEGIADAYNFYAELKAELISRGSKFFSPKAAEPASPVVAGVLSYEEHRRACMFNLPAYVFGSSPRNPAPAESRAAQLTPVVVANKSDAPKRINDQPPSHWTENDGWKRHPQSVDEWNWHNDAYPDAGERSELRLNFSADLADPHAPDQMAVVLRIDLLRVMARMQHAEAYKRFHLERKSIAPAQEEPAPVAPVVVSVEETPKRPETTDIDRGNGNDVDGYYADEADAYMDHLEQKIARLLAHPSPLPETFEEWWAVFNKSEFARAKLGIGTDFAPYGSSNYYVLKACAGYTWNAGRGER